MKRLKSGRRHFPRQARSLERQRLLDDRDDRDDRPERVSPTVLWLMACLTCMAFACDAQTPSSPSSAPPSSSPPPAPAVGSDSRPNILLYIVDTLRADALGPYRGDPKQTPEIGKFARDAIVFENAFAQSSWTRASVASILTSQYPRAHGAEDRGDRLVDAAQLMSETLSAHGYYTGLITTNPNVGAFFGFDQGFDDLIEMFAAKTDDVVSPKELIASADDVAKRVNHWIDNAPKPFFLVVLSIDPHSPYSPPARFTDAASDYRGQATGTGPWINRKDLTADDKAHIRALYQAEVNYADYGFGLVINHLRTQGLFEKTITALTSDHGEEFWEHGRRGHGRGLLHEVLHVPLVIRDPARTSESGTRDSTLVETIDILPTLLESAGLTATGDIAGRSLFGPKPALTPGAFASLKLGDHHLASVRSGMWNLVWDLKSGNKQLFDGSEGADVQVRTGAEARTAALSRSLEAHLASTALQRKALHGDSTGASLRLDEIPDAERQLLIELGYIDDGPAPETRSPSK